MAEPDTQHSNENVIGVSERPPNPQSISELMLKAVRLLSDVTDTLRELFKDSGVSQLGGADEISKFSQRMGVIERMAGQSAEIRSALEAKRGRETHLAELAAELGEPEDAVFNKALAFFKDAIEAERRGDQVVIVNKDYDIVTELSGFMSGAPSSQ